MNRTDVSRWHEVWEALGAGGDSATWHRRLVAAYGEPTRRYHTARHLDECLTAFDDVRSLAREPAQVEAALWFHDAVYDPRSSTNEEDSAKLAAECLSSAGVAEDGVAAVRRLVLATKTHNAEGHSDAALLIDIDLAILGQPLERFSEYEHDIRAEYAWVEERTFREKRAAILDDFLQRPRIFATTPFRVRYEATARANLRSAIARLRG